MSVEQDLLQFIIIDNAEIQPEPEYKPIVKKQREQQEAEARAAAVYKEHQENIHKAGQLRTDILRGLQQGENSYNLLLQAMQCISFMTGDTVFYTQGKDIIQAVHGIGLKQAAAAEIELQEVQQRLKLLSRPELQKEPENNRRRINNAIKQHKDRIAQLQSIIS